MDRGDSHRDKAKPQKKHNSNIILIFLLQNQLTKSPIRGKNISKLKLKKTSWDLFSYKALVKLLNLVIFLIHKKNHFVLSFLPLLRSR